MEGLINVQNNLRMSIEKGLTNFKKSPKDRLTLEYLETRLENLENDWQLFRKNNSKLFESFEIQIIQKSSYVGNELYEKTEEVYFTYKCLLKSSLNKLFAIKHEEGSNSTKGPEEAYKSLAKLPKISIPTFSGRYSEWTTFRDLFISLVDKNGALDNVQKLHYLKGCLTGEAEQLIRYSPITDANYSQCWSTLEDRYNNKRYLSNCILKRLFSQKRMIVESATSLKELLDTTSDCLNAFSHLGVDVSTWDIIILHIISSKLDTETQKQWELHISSQDSNELPTFKQFKTFIESRFRALECLESKRSQGSSAPFQKRKVLLATQASRRKCEYCSEEHKLCFCKQFAKQSLEHRREFVGKNKICFNCLGSNHNVSNCKKPTCCQICKRRHHTLLHNNSVNTGDNQSKSNNSNVEGTSSSTSAFPIVSCISTGSLHKVRQVLLATALLKSESKTGEFQLVRALLDQGSQANFITESTVQFLKLRKSLVQGTVSGLGGNKSIKIKYQVSLVIRSTINPQFYLQIQAYVLSNITSCLPECNIEVLDWPELNDLQLADPEFNKPSKIDLLLGAEVYGSILRSGMKRSPSGMMIAQSTSLGWILSGVVSPVNTNDKPLKYTINVMHAQVNLDDMLRTFWEIEEQAFKSRKILTEEEERCQILYKNTTKRTVDGRYIVKLPFRDAEPMCKAGGSRDIAVAKFKSLERRFSNDSKLKRSYTEGMAEYLHLGHMRQVKDDDDKRNEAVYLSHHPVIREEKSTTKLRIVLNASEKNKKGISLNETLMVGPTLQADLRHTVLRWRIYPIALVADIIKMYRQILISEEDSIYQRIVWRDDPAIELKDYELITVTFGTACAPYLAVRTLQQTAQDEGENYPLAKEKVLNSFYMDDLMTGCYSVDEGIELYEQITALLGKGKFTLQKWNSNNKDLLKIIKSRDKRSEEEIRLKANKFKKEDKEEKIKKVREQDERHNDNQARIKINSKNIKALGKEEENLEIKLDTTIKILGLTWNRNEDCFQYAVNSTLPTGPVTKRVIVSEIARLFDPVGWIAPSIVLAKVFIQKLWLSGVSWDEELPTELINEWSTYRAELPYLAEIRIPRWLSTMKEDGITELHGFCDASKAAYSAVVYMRTVDKSARVHVSLVVAKTRVAPVKQISIPRLELCGAVLVAKLLREVAEVFHIQKNKITAWTDSMVVLGWLSRHPGRWKTFVANRVSEVLDNLETSQWCHVASRSNPADCASRGVLPSQLAANTTWFCGPPFLQNQTLLYERPKSLPINLEEAVKTHFVSTQDGSFFERFSCLKRVIRVVAYCRRWLKGNSNSSTYLNKTELDEAYKCCVRKSQREEFNEEYLQLKCDSRLQMKSSKLKSLCPYLDDSGIIRVRGRLQNALLDDEAKHPIVLPKKNHFTRLIIADAHAKTLHGGPQLMINYLRTGYWIIGCRSMVKYHVLKCVTCIRQKSNIKHQMMGSLPKARCTPARPFLHSGLDYAGPINIRTTKGRGHRSYKGYICLFVCMATRAIHLELVSDMSTQTFLAAFKRFVSRRGHCTQLWSDNGSTFIGASRELKLVESIQQSAAEFLEANHTKWHFIPPHAPNFGGLWEAGVKSTKFHLKRVIGESTLTYEEMSTLLTQVEACLNSRPMGYIDTTDPSEPLPLTPGHFLIGEPLLSVPETDYQGSTISCLSRWQFVQRMVQTFWKRWSQEYLTTLMHRHKWTTRIPEPNVGDVVLVKEDDLPPSRWLLGRVIEKHPGHDNITRVVTLRTKCSIVKRPTSKLCILPVVNDVQT